MKATEVRIDSKNMALENPSRASITQTINKKNPAGGFPGRSERSDPSHDKPVPTMAQANKYLI